MYVRKIGEVRIDRPRKRTKLEISRSISISALFDSQEGLHKYSKGGRWTLGPFATEPEEPNRRKTNRFTLCVIPRPWSRDRVADCTSGSTPISHFSTCPRFPDSSFFPFSLSFSFPFLSFLPFFLLFFFKLFSTMHVNSSTRSPRERKEKIVSRSKGGTEEEEGGRKRRGETVYIYIYI